MRSDEVVMIRMRVVTALVVRALEIGAGQSCSLCQNGSGVFHLPKWQNQLNVEIDHPLRYLTKSPQKTRSSAGSRLALLEENTALLMRYLKTTSRIPERRSTAKMAGFALLEEFGRDLPVLLALLVENRGVLHDFRARACRPELQSELWLGSTTLWPVSDRATHGRPKVSSIVARHHPARRPSVRRHGEVGRPAPSRAGVPNGDRLDVQKLLNYQFTNSAPYLRFVGASPRFLPRSAGSDLRFVANPRQIFARRGARPRKFQCFIRPQKWTRFALRGKNCGDLPVWLALRGKNSEDSGVFFLATRLPMKRVEFDLLAPVDRVAHRRVRQTPAAFRADSPSLIPSFKFRATCFPNCNLCNVARCCAKTTRLRLDEIREVCKIPQLSSHLRVPHVIATGTRRSQGAVIQDENHRGRERNQRLSKGVHSP
jgi:hypothetical protein